MKWVNFFNKETINASCISKLYVKQEGLNKFSLNLEYDSDNNDTVLVIAKNRFVCDLWLSAFNYVLNNLKEGVVGISYETELLIRGIINENYKDLKKAEKESKISISGLSHFEVLLRKCKLDIIDIVKEREIKSCQK